MRTVLFMQDIKGREDQVYGWYRPSRDWRYGQLAAAGWKPVTGDHAKEIFGENAYEAMKDEHGWVSYKGLVLHSRAKQLKLREEAEAAIRRAQRRQIPRDKFLEEIDKVPGLKPFVMDSLDEYRDRKAHDLGLNAPRVTVPGAPDVAAAAAAKISTTPPPAPPTAAPTPTPGPVTEAAAKTSTTASKKAKKE